MRIGITGHQGLPGRVADAVEGEMRVRLAGLGVPVRGFTCLADGADQIFARAVLGAGEAIVPAARYRDELAAGARPGYDELWAVWDGLPARGYGGTADVIALAGEKAYR